MARKVIYRAKINVLQKKQEEEYRPPQGSVIYRNVARLPRNVSERNKFPAHVIVKRQISHVTWKIYFYVKHQYMQRCRTTP